MRALVYRVCRPQEYQPYRERHTVSNAARPQIGRALTLVRSQSAVHLVKQARKHSLPHLRACLGSASLRARVVVSRRVSNWPAENGVILANGACQPYFTLNHYKNTLSAAA